MINASIQSFSRLAMCAVIPVFVFGCDSYFDDKKITGVVLDNFGNPIANAKVSIKNSSFTALSNQAGEFSLDYVPGNFTVLISAERHTTRTVELNIQEKASYPLDKTTLFLKPPLNALQLVGNDSYIPLIPFLIEERELKSKGFMNSQYEYRVTGADWNEASAKALVDTVTEHLHNFDQITIVDGTSAKLKLVVLNRDRIGISTFGPMNGKQDITVLPESFLNLEGFSYRISKNLQSAWSDSDVACYVQFGETMMGQEAILKNMPAFCLAKNIDALLGLHSLSAIPTQVIESLGSMAVFKLAISEFFHAHKRFPENFQEAGIKDKARFVPFDSAVNLIPGTGALVLTLGPSAGERLNRYSMYLVPELAPHGTVRWSCFSDAQILEHVPQSCQQTYLGNLLPVSEDKLNTTTPVLNSIKRQESMESEYRTLITNKITSNWLRPKSAKAGLRCEVNVVQIPGGEIISANITNNCNADEETRRSIIAAVERVDALPYKGFEDVFSREINFNFSYDGN